MSNPTTIRNWSIKRSGARMTITGTDLTGAAVKVSADTVEAPSAVGLFAAATDKKTGRVYALAF